MAVTGRCTCGHSFMNHANGGLNMTNTECLAANCACNSFLYDPELTANLKSRR